MLPVFASGGPVDPLLILLAALSIDALIGDPPALWRRLPHPVMLIGRLIGWLDLHLNRDQRSAADRRLRGALMALIETALVAGGFHDPRAAATGESNAWGDHVGHTAALAMASAPVLAATEPYHPGAAQIRTGYGSVLIARFTDWARVHGVRVIGGLPTGFADSPIPNDALDAIRAIYAAHGALFLELPNRSLYPRGAFFDTAEHLNESWQAVHSVAVARGLAGMLQEQQGLATVMQEQRGLAGVMQDQRALTGLAMGPTPAAPP